MHFKNWKSWCFSWSMFTLILCGIFSSAWSLAEQLDTPTEKEKHLRIKCDEKDYSACNQLGLLIEERHPKQSEEFYRKACKFGFADACNNLGYLFFSTKRPKEAITFFEKGCKLNLVDSCNNLNKMGKKPSNGLLVFEVKENSPELKFVPMEFLKLGPMVIVDSFILSNVAKSEMQYQDAVEFCAKMGSGISLVSESLWRSISKDIFSPPDNPNIKFMSNFQGNKFWGYSSDPKDPHHIYLFDLPKIEVFEGSEYAKASVRCVLPLKKVDP